ncbi:MAG TPA: CDP-alcohol phosphatidyltransferase family protein [Myxococcota bacterium]|nr:CDP-alcohol phosphatidyltransferase family protein [Myxococcota bacterium]HOA12566.1 CDP-alcohol phosphatidyltransferase family protein [Myxococcota bacterium]HOD00522.1 CDP-alcohol phosphatidyltransferase family protein [Myxococcota bacterium]HOH76467.1 CDP-alcohol phosphatidyltransferase family protein [Myxococcota bacterium]HPV03540.1 CDP-alcohol phosphatidyltransferase family protein [Myxococcota bacterium]
MFFKAKDLMTVGNIGGGVAAIIVAMNGMSKATTPEEGKIWLFWSAMCILFAWVFDAFDGKVARWLGQMNRFGSEFDNVADLVAYSVAPSFVVYFAYAKVLMLPGLASYPLAQQVIAVVLGAIPVTSGCIRFARFNTVRMDVPGFFIGFPRPASALLIVALLNSHLMEVSLTMRWVGVAMVVFLGIMNLTLMPFISHHGKEFSSHLKFVLHCVWMTVAFSFLAGILVPLVSRLVGHPVKPLLPTNLVLDWVVIWLSFYVSVAWTEIPAETLRRVRIVTAAYNRDSEHAPSH